MFSNSPARPYAARVSHDISPRELAECMKQPAPPLLLDVREPSEAALASIDGARLIPLQTLPQHLGELDKTREIVLCCHHGVRSLAALEFMKRAGQRFPVESSCFIAAKICEGLTYAHELVGSDGAQMQIVHRDMSPPNVLITKHGEIKIVDFGLAKATSQLEKSEAGIIKGKFSYLSPEAAQGQEVDARTDIFAVGIILWEMLSGKRLFLADTDFGTVKLVQQAQIPSLRTENPGVPPELEAILARALARDPAKRYSSARDLGRDLTNTLYKLGRPVSAYDIAELVRGAMALRKKAQPDKASIIDKLIEEALLEFTSLQDDKAAPAAARVDEPLKLGGFEDIGGWADEIANVAAPGPTSRDLVRNSLPSGAFVEGNLAALEDDEPDSSGAAPASPSSAPPAALAPAAPASTRAPATTTPIAPASSGGATRLILLVAALLVVAAGAWFGGLIPH